jgi:citrate lyase subunit beta/citryl-CoA lyase
MLHAILARTIGAWRVTILRSLLFVPATRERAISRASRSAADAIILDLEDAVGDDGKVAARGLARASIAEIAGAGKAALVRLNGIHSGLTRDDLMATVGEGLSAVVLPKVEHPQDLRDLDVLLREAEMSRGVRPGTVGVIPIIESARALLRCEAIAGAIDRLTGLAIGGEDYTADLGVERDASGLALQHIRGVITQVAVAYALLPIDAPYIDFKDAPGLVRDSKTARAIGLKGKFVIHPDQIAAVNRMFSPNRQELAQANRVVAAYDARADGLAVINVDGRMVDAPVAERARRTLELAARLKRRTP